MQITARPRRSRGGRLLARALGGLVVLLAVALLTPAALGLQHRAVGDSAMGGSLSRGALVLGEEANVEELMVGDVISFRSPVEGEDAWVTRRVVEVEPDGLVTGGDARTELDPWLLRAGVAEPLLVSHTVPWLGYPLLLLGETAAPLLGALLAVAIVLGVVRRRHTGPAHAPRPTSTAGERRTSGPRATAA